MLIDFQNYFTAETIYLWSSFGILPFWIILIFMPNSKITQIFVNSIIIPLILACAYVFIIYQTIVLDKTTIDLVNPYLSLENLYTFFATESFLLVFWLHFLALNLFLGTWVAREGVKYGMSRSLVFIFLLLIYFFGPIGLVLYWLVRIFYAKKLGLHD